MICCGWVRASAPDGEGWAARNLARLHRLTHSAEQDAVGLLDSLHDRAQQLSMLIIAPVFHVMPHLQEVCCGGSCCGGCCAQIAMGFIGCHCILPMTARGWIRWAWRRRISNCELASERPRFSSAERMTCTLPSQQEQVWHPWGRLQGLLHGVLVRGMPYLPGAEEGKFVSCTA